MALQVFEYELGLFDGLADIDGLREEVDAGVQTRGGGTGDVGFIPGVQKEPAFGIAPVTQTDIGKVKLLGCCLPVHPPLMLRDIHAELGGKGAARVDGNAVHGAELLPRQSRGRDVLIGRHPDILEAVVDEDLACMLIHLLGYDQKKNAEQGNNQNGADQQVFQFSVAGFAHSFLRRDSCVFI